MGSPLFMRNCELYERQNALSIAGIYRTISMICCSQGASSFIRQQYLFDTLPRLKSWDSTSTRPLAVPVLRLSVTAWCPTRRSIFTQGSPFELIPYGIVCFSGSGILLWIYLCEKMALVIGKSFCDDKHNLHSFFCKYAKRRTSRYWKSAFKRNVNCTKGKAPFRLLVSIVQF